MHRITLPDGTTRQSSMLRWSRVSAYTMFGTAGGLFLASDVLQIAYGITAVWMAAFIALGGLLCAVGAASCRWPGEFCGLPLLGTGFAVLGLEVYRAGYDTIPWLASGNLALFLGLAAMIAARWRATLAVYRLARAVAQVATPE